MRQMIWVHKDFIKDADKWRACSAWFEHEVNKDPAYRDQYMVGFVHESDHIETVEHLMKRIERLRAHLRTMAEPLGNRHDYTAENIDEAVTCWAQEALDEDDQLERNPPIS